jgi:hypothetical protein
MKKLLSSILLVATLTPFHGQAQQPGSTLVGFLAKQGFAGAKLERRFGNHLFVPVFHQQPARGAPNRYRIAIQPH